MRMVVSDSNENTSDTDIKRLATNTDTFRYHIDNARVATAIHYEKGGTESDTSHPTWASQGCPQTLTHSYTAETLEG